MKKRVLTVSLSLLACLCCCFSGFGSVKAYAYTGDYVTTFPIIFGADTDGSFPLLQLYNNDNLVLEKMAGSLSDYNVYQFSNSSVYPCSAIFINNTNGPIEYNYLPDLYDYYICLSFRTLTDNISTFTFKPSYVEAVFVDRYNNSTVEVGLTDMLVLLDDDKERVGFTVIGKLPSVYSSAVSAFNLYDERDVAVGANLEFEGLIVSVDKSQNSSTQSIIAAINNQTGTLQGSIGQAADDVQQSIEDQYQMEDEEDFGFSDIQQQYEEKMGVLTFGTETTIQMLELFSPSNAGEAYIRVPGWTMEVQGETYQIWDEYVFYFDSIEENFPFLVTTMRTFTVAMFYVAIVGYITKVYERNFLAK